MPRVLVGVFGGGLAALVMGGWFVFDMVSGGERLRRDGVCRTAEVSASHGFHVPKLGRFAELSYVADGRDYRVTAAYDGRRMPVGQPVRICSEPADPAVFTFGGDSGWTGESFWRWFRGDVAGLVLVVGGVLVLSVGFTTFVSGGGGPTAYRARH